MKNPFLSMWLSAANTAAGSARGFWTAELHRQQKAFTKGLAAPASKKRPSRKAQESSPEVVPDASPLHASINMRVVEA